MVLASVLRASVVMVVILLFKIEQGAAASRDCGEVDLGVVDAIEDIGEDVGREGETDLHQLGVAVSRGFDRGEILVADGAAGLRELTDEAGQHVAVSPEGCPWRICLSGSGFAPASLARWVWAATQ